MKRLIMGAPVACLVFFVPASLQALDVSDFVSMHEPTKWNMEGTATVATESVELTGYVESQVMNSFHVEGEKAMHFQFLFQGGTYSFSHVMVLRLTDEYLWLEYRISILSWNHSPLDWDEEMYATSAGIIPRQFETETIYDYIAQLNTGAVSNAIIIGQFEPRTTTQGWEVDALRLDLFTEGTHPLTMWVARNVGIIEIDLQMDGGGFPVYANMKLVGDPETWDPDAGTGQWDDTTNNGDGWRESEDFGDFWTPDIDSEWVMHHSLGWSFCHRGESGLIPYVPGIGWMWTSSELYPIFYIYDLNTWIYQDTDDRSLFFDFTAGEWIILGQGG